MVRVKYGNVYSTIEEATEEEMEQIRGLLTLESPTKYYSDKYQSGTWDGCFRFYKGRTFPSGFIGLLRDKVEMEIVGFRKGIIPDRLNINILKTKSFDGIYSYQYDTLKEALIKKRGILHLATNSGKTAIAAGITAALNLPTLFLVERIDLLEQTYDVFCKELGIEIGKVGGGNEIIKDVTIGLTKTIYNRISKKNRDYINWIRDIRVLVLDECFVGNTTIHTENGLKKISTLVNSSSNEKVWSFNDKLGIFELKQIINWYKRTYRGDLIRLSFGKNKIEVTPNHEFWMFEDGNIVKKKASDLCIGDRSIKLVNSKPFTTNYSLSKEQREAVVGMVLGDGSLAVTSNNRKARLRFTHGKKQLSYLQYKLGILENLCNTEGIYKGKSGYTNNDVYCINTYSTLDFYDLYNKIYCGKEEDFLGVLNELTPVSLAFWIMDDGSLNKKVYTLSTHSFSKEKNEVIVSILNSKFGLKSRLCFDKRVKKYYIVFSTEASKRLSSIIAPYVHTSMEYKLLQDDRDILKHNFNLIEKLDYGVEEVTGVDYIKSMQKYVYNIEVEDNHNYVVSSGNLVSNCHGATNHTYSTVAKKCVNADYRFGLSGTPFGKDLISKYILVGLTGDTISTVSNYDLIQANVSSSPKVYITKIHSDIRTNLFLENKSEAYANVYHAGIINNEERNREIVDIAKFYYDKGKTVLILIKMIEHGDILRKLFEEQGIVVPFCYGGTSVEVRKNSLAQIKSGEQRLLILSSIGEVGLDIPQLDVMIRASGGKSSISTLQSIGRLLRNTTQKFNEVKFFDFNDRGHKYLESHSRTRKADYKNERFEVQCRRLGERLPK